ncbi:MAG: hypothetical protein BWZ02_00233 [Lentisphaerae bacterium ADurb.BinA184]|nr:MAG: hypothetical protein BWZ02_00233 [Lentisphaerae bacterium ADurb.BinA184]
MRKRLILALLVIGIAVVVLLFNHTKSVELNLVFGETGRLSAPLLYLGWMAIGVVVGGLLID